MGMEKHAKFTAYREDNKDKVVIGIYYNRIREKGRSQRILVSTGPYYKTIDPPGSEVFKVGKGVYVIKDKDTILKTEDPNAM